MTQNTPNPRKKFKIDWEQQRRIMPDHDNWVPPSYLLNNLDDKFGLRVVLHLINELIDMIHLV